MRGALWCVAVVVMVGGGAVRVWGETMRVETIDIREEGASAVQMDQQMSGVLMEAVGGIGGTTHLETRAEEGRVRAVVRSTLEGGALHAAVLKAVGTVRGKLPRDCVVEVEDWNAEELPAVWMAVSSEGLSAVDLAEAVRREVVPSVHAVEGVRRAELRGGPYRQTKVDINTEAMAALGVEPGELAKTLEASPGGKRSAAEMEGVVVAMRQGAPVYVRDVAKVSEEVVARDFAGVDGKRSEVLALRLLPGAKPVAAGRLNSLGSAGVRMEVVCNLTREAATLIEVTVPAGTSAAAQEDAGARVEKALLAAQGGVGHSVRVVEGSRVIRILLTGGDAGAADVAVHKVAEQWPEFAFRSCPVGGGNLLPFPVCIVLSGPDSTRVRLWGEATKKRVQLAGMASAAVMPGADVVVPEIVVDREKATKAGVSTAEIDRAVREAKRLSLSDLDGGMVSVGDVLARVEVKGVDGSSLKLSVIAQVKVQAQPEAVVRWDGREVVVITAAGAGQTTGEAAGTLQKAAGQERAALGLAEGYGVIEPGK